MSADRTAWSDDAREPSVAARDRRSSSNVFVISTLAFRLLKDVLHNILSRRTRSRAIACPSVAAVARCFEVIAARSHTSVLPANSDVQASLSAADAATYTSCFSPYASFRTDLSCSCCDVFAANAEASEATLLASLAGYGPPAMARRYLSDLAAIAVLIAATAAR